VARTVVTVLYVVLASAASSSNTPQGRGYKVNQTHHNTSDAKEALQRALSRLRCALQFLTMLQTILAQAQTVAPQAVPGGGIGSFFVPLIFIFIIMYFVMIRPQKKRQQQQQNLIASLKTGDRVVTNAGIHGLISNVKENTVLVKVADNVKIEMEKSAITNVLKEG
jgi:preprotein translocase subunit YajC